MRLSSRKIVEICGLPGSGKTTLARKLEAEGIQRVMVVTKLQILSNFFLGFIFRPVHFSKGLSFAIRHTKTFTEFWNFYVYRYARYYKASRASSDVCILDEGPMQSVYSYAINHVPEVELLHLVALLPVADVTILLSVDETVRYMQFEKRKEQRPEHEFWKTRSREPELMLAERVIRSVLDNTPQFRVASSIEQAAVMARSICQ